MCKAHAGRRGHSGGAENREPAGRDVKDTEGLPWAGDCRTSPKWGSEGGPGDPAPLPTGGGSRSRVLSHTHRCSLTFMPAQSHSHTLTRRVTLPQPTLCHSHTLVRTRAPVYSPTYLRAPTPALHMHSPTVALTHLDTLSYPHVYLVRHIHAYNQCIYSHAHPPTPIELRTLSYTPTQSSPTHGCAQSCSCTLIVTRAHAHSCTPPAGLSWLFALGELAGAPRRGLPQTAAAVRCPRAQPAGRRVTRCPE